MSEVLQPLSAQDVIRALSPKINDPVLAILREHKLEAVISGIQGQICSLGPYKLISLASGLLDLVPDFTKDEIQKRLQVVILAHSLDHTDVSNNLFTQLNNPDFISFIEEKLNSTGQNIQQINKFVILCVDGNRHLIGASKPPVTSPIPQITTEQRNKIEDVSEVLTNALTRLDNLLKLSSGQFPQVSEVSRRKIASMLCGITL